MSAKVHFKYINALLLGIANFSQLEPPAVCATLSDAS